ncbi:hypothetical protein AeMF1_003943 [Aphanomyces euteiches]|nr:hypothetical protein AeMF1_003943 [Aphanomyces euteiches]
MDWEDSARLIMLPVDVILKIAFYIPDANDLFAFIEALRRHCNLGPLDHLHKLGLQFKYADLWPSLHLQSPPRHSNYMASYEAVAKFFTNVVLVESWLHPAWLKTHLNPMAEIQWKLDDCPDDLELLGGYSDLPITKIKLILREDSPYIWNDLLPRLRHLTSLSVDTYGEDVGSCFEFVASSKKITEFKIRPIMCDITEVDLMYLTQWLQNQPVRDFECSLTNLDDIDIDVRQQFYEALFNCSTLDRLCLISCKLIDLDLTRFKFKMRTLSLWSSTFSSSIVESLARQFERSSIERLALSYDEKDDITGLECLLRALPLTSIKNLTLTDLRFDSQHWSHLSPLFEKCELKSLSLKGQNLDSTFGKCFSQALQNNHTILELCVNFDDIAMDFLKLLIQRFSHPDQLVGQRRFKMNMVSWQTEDEEDVESIMEFAAECGCQLVQGYDFF